METFQEHYLSMKRTIAARKLNVDMALIDRAVDYARVKHKDQKRKDGSPYIGAGCRQFTLAQALEHWGNHKCDRRATMAQLQYAQALVALRG